MSIPAIGYLYIGISILVCFFNIKRTAYFFVAINGFTTITVIYFFKENILWLHIIFLIFFIKVLIYICRNGSILIKKNNLMLWFVLYCTVSLIFVFFNQNVEAVSIDGGMAKLSFSFHQITQLGYLLIAFISYSSIKLLLRKQVITYVSILKALEWGYVIVIILGLLQQFVLPADIVNMTYRNLYKMGYAAQGSRVSSTFGEPSMFSAYAAPMFIYMLHSVLNKFDIKKLLAMIGNIIIVINNQSSTFYFGILVAGIVWIGIMILNKKIKKRRLVSVLLFLIGSVLFSYFFREQIQTGITALYEKLTRTGAQAGRRTSGQDRYTSFKMTVQVFKASPILGVGFGSLRSTDLFSMFLAELGMIGNVLFYGYFLKLFYQLLSKKESEYNVIFLMIFTALVTLLISVPEFSFLLIWILMGIAEWSLENQYEYESV